MRPSDENANPLICLRDNTPVRGESPECLHPSSQCAFREFCPVREAARKASRLLDLAQGTD